MAFVALGRRAVTPTARAGTVETLCLTLASSSLSSSVASSSSSSSSSCSCPIPSSSHSYATQAQARTRKAPAQHFTKAQKRAGEQRKKLNLEKRALRRQLAEETRPDPVLGYRVGNSREAGVNDEALWERCELKSILLSKSDAWGLTEDRRGNLTPSITAGALGTPEEQQRQLSLGGPLRLNFGMGDDEREVLFKDLPDVVAKDRVLDTLADAEAGSGPRSGSAKYRAGEEEMDSLPLAEQVQREFEALQQQEAQSASVLSRVLDLRNASAKGIDLENKRRIISHFGGGTNTGSVETQVAILTYRLHMLHEHLSQPQFRKDEVTRRSMGLLTFKRARLLKYWRREKGEEGYLGLLKRVGVNRRAVEGEIMLGGRPKMLAG